MNPETIAALFAIGIALLAGQRCLYSYRRTLDSRKFWRTQRRGK